MTNTSPAQRFLALLALVPALAACGSSQSSGSTPATVTVTAPTPATTSAPAPAPAPAPQPTTTSSAPTGGATSPAPTRTGPGPAFTRTTGGTPAGGELQAASAKLRAAGFAPLSSATYDPNQTLRVLVGARSGSAGGHAQQAFFFDGARYLGTDAAATSGIIAVTGHADTDVTLRYGIYRAGDPDCCPSGPPRTVRFALDGGRLVALDPIPDAAARR